MWSIVSAPAQWTTWTPTITQSAGLTSIARNVDYATYFKLGRFVTATWTVTITGSGTSGYPVAVSLPVPAAAYFLLVGVGEVYDTSGPGGAYKLPFTAFISTSTTIDLRSTAPAGVLDNRIGVATGLNIGLASGDQIYGTVTYEAAS